MFTLKSYLQFLKLLFSHSAALLLNLIELSRSTSIFFKRVFLLLKLFFFSAALCVLSYKLALNISEFEVYAVIYFQIQTSTNIYRYLQFIIIYHLPTIKFCHLGFICKQEDGSTVGIHQEEVFLCFLFSNTKTEY